MALACLEARDEMPALEREIEEAIEEGVLIHNSWGAKTIPEPRRYRLWRRVQTLCLGV